MNKMKIKKNKIKVYTIKRNRNLKSFLSQQGCMQVFILPRALQLWVLFACFLIYWEKQMPLLFGPTFLPENVPKAQTEPPGVH